MSHLRLLTEYLKGKGGVRFIEEIEAEELDRYLGEFFVNCPAFHYSREMIAAKSKE